MVESARRKEAEKETKDLQEKPNQVFKLVKLMKRDGKDVRGGRCISCICIFDRVPSKVMKSAIRKKKVPEVMVKAVMSLYNGAKTKV